MTRHPSPPATSGAAARGAAHPGIALLLLLSALLFVGCGEDAPAGVSTESLEGVWSGTLFNVTLMGRTLSGDIDWRFTRDQFDIVFQSPPIGGTERIGGDWKFHKGKVVLELRTSFPIQDDVGTRDTLFVSILDNELSIKTLAGSDILLRKTARVDAGRGPHDVRLCKSETPRLPRPSASTLPANRSVSRCCPAWSPDRRLKPASSRT